MIKMKTLHLKVFFTLALLHNFFYFLPKTMGGLTSFNLLFLLTVAMITFAVFKQCGKIECGHFGIMLLWIPVMIVFSACGALIHYNQKLILGIATQRAWLVSAWLYFLFMFWISREHLDYQTFEDALYIVVATELVIWFTQWFLGEDRLFLTIGYNYRNDTLRLYCDINYMLMLAIIAVNNALNRKKVLLNIIFVAMILLYHLLVNKSRMAIVQLLLAVFLTALLSKNISIKLKCATIIVGCIAGMCIILTNEMILDLFLIFFGGKEDGTMLVRQWSWQFYLEKWKSTPYAFFFGYGYGNSNILASNIATGVTEGYLIADNGIYGFIFCYGLVGLMWFFWYQIRLCKLGISIYRSISPVILVRFLVGLLGYSMNSSFYHVYNSFDMTFIIIITELLYKHLQDSSPKNEEVIQCQ